MDATQHMGNYVHMQLMQRNYNYVGAIIVQF
jgi:hypothetical protein